MDTTLRKKVTEPVSIRMTVEDLDRLDYVWTTLTHCSNRSVFVREAIDEKMAKTLEAEKNAR